MRAINFQRSWTSKEALVLLSVCLAVGIGGGWLIRGLQPSTKTSPQAATETLAPAPNAAAAPDSAKLKQMADAQAAPLLARLNSNPKDPETLTSIANLYYDAQQYPTAVDFYNRALQSRPSDASVRTDMATAYWYMGKPDEAIAEFNKALAYAPTNPNTLFNLGLVKWQGKHDGAGAIADWKKLLDSNPNYDQKDKVLQMLSDVEKQSGAKASTRG